MCPGARGEVISIEYSLRYEYLSHRPGCSALRVRARCAFPLPPSGGGSRYIMKALRLPPALLVPVRAVRVAPVFRQLWPRHAWLLAGLARPSLGHEKYRAPLRNRFLFKSSSSIGWEGGPAVELSSTVGLLFLQLGERGPVVSKKGNRYVVIFELDLGPFQKLQCTDCLGKYQGWWLRPSLMLPRSTPPVPRGGNGAVRALLRF